MLDEGACLRTAWNLVRVNSQPFLPQPVTRWISPVARQGAPIRFRSPDLDGSARQGWGGALRRENGAGVLSTH